MSKYEYYREALTGTGPKLAELTLESAIKLMQMSGGNLDLRGSSITTLPEGLTVGGSLDLSGSSIMTLPEGLTVGGSLYLRGSSITTLPEGLTVGGSLDLSGSSITTLPEGLTVGGSLYLRGSSITTLPEGLTVGGWLDLCGSSITTLPEGLTVGGSLYLSGSSITTLPEGLTVGGWLDLCGTSITTLPEGFTVGGWLDLSGSSITTLPEGLTVGGWLGLSGSSITTLPEGLTVGGWLDLRGTSITDATKVQYLHDGDYVEGRFLFADGILTHIKRKKQVNGYTCFIGKIPGRNVVYDGTHYAHCNRLRDGIADLIFKSARDRGADQYKGISLDKSIPLDEMRTMYRIITGACQQGTQNFIDGLGDKLKSEYTIREVIALTENQYGGSRFSEFFSG